MLSREVDFQVTTNAVLKNFNHGFSDMVVNLLRQRNTVRTTTNGCKGVYADVCYGYGLLVIANNHNEVDRFTITTEFLVPCNELAASYMVMWRRWCDKRSINSKDGLLSIVDKVVDNMNRHIVQGQANSNSNLAIGLMGAVLDNYPEVIMSMQWSVANGYVPCLVVANDNKVAKCGVCYGGKYISAK